jgi:hypothetical protein
MVVAVICHPSGVIMDVPMEWVATLLQMHLKMLTQHQKHQTIITKPQILQIIIMKFLKFQ